MLHDRGSSCAVLHKLVERREVMQDYYHYHYECPYCTGTEHDRVRCEDGSRVVFPSMGACKRWLRKYCADPKGWEQCTISQMMTEQIELKMELRKGIKAWTKKKNSQRNS